MNSSSSQTKCTHARTHTLTHSLTRTHARAHTHTLTHSHTHTQTQTHTRAHTQQQYGPQQKQGAINAFERAVNAQLGQVTGILNPHARATQAGCEQKNKTSQPSIPRKKVANKPALA